MENKTLEDIFQLKEYSLSSKEKEEVLLPIIKEGVKRARRNPQIDSFLEKESFDSEKISSLSQIPGVPIQMFKDIDLSTCDKKDIIQILKSSGTTSSEQSKVPLNQETLINQGRAFQSSIVNYFGSEKRVFLVIDHKGIIDPKREITSRTAIVRAPLRYAKETYFLLKETEDGRLVLDMDVINEVIRKHSNDDIIAFGFTYIVWSVFYKQAKDAGISFKFPNLKLFHAGGWKKLSEEKVSKEAFSKELARLFGISYKEVCDFYGMAEQNGVIFIDCKEGNKHVPNFAKVIIRDTQTLEPVQKGQTGIIEIMSALGTSYYSQAILTEDLGEYLGDDDCPCGRHGEYFRFKGRLKKAPLRGCGDTFKEKK